ncbi:MAG: hypothetical protein BWK79_10455, partial [Beggiatoa sp. IS2]
MPEQWTTESIDECSKYSNSQRKEHLASLNQINMKGFNTDTLTVKTKLQVIFKHDNLYSVSCLVNPEERDKSLDRMLAEVVSVDSLYRTSSCSRMLGGYIYKAIELCTQGYTIQIMAETLSINTQRA